MPGKTFPQSGKSTGEGRHGGGLEDIGDEGLCSMTKMIVVAASRRSIIVFKENTEVAGRRVQNLSKADTRGVSEVGEGPGEFRTVRRSGVERSPLPGASGL